MPLLPRLPRPAWLILGGDLVSALGTGMTIPFFIVYLHRMRGLGLGTAGLALATIALASFAGNVVGGSLSDRAGARRALAVGLVCSAAGAAWFAFVHGTAAAFGAAAVIGLGASISWPSLDALLALAVSAEQTSNAFAVRHATFNAGLAAGGVAAAAIVDFGSLRSFQALYLADAATFLAFLPLLALLRGVGGRPEHTDAADGGYRAVLADRAFVAIWLLTAAIVAVGYAQYQAAVPPYAAGTGGVSAHGLGIAFAANAIAVVVLQLVVLRLLGGRRRTSALAAACLCFALAWCVAIAAAHVGGGNAATAGFAAAMCVLALAETLLSPVLAPIVNALADDRLRGRYNGTFVLAWTTGFAVGPAVAGGGLKLGDGTPYFALLAGAAVVVAVAGRRLRRHLPAAIDVVPANAPERLLQAEAA